MLDNRYCKWREIRFQSVPKEISDGAKRTLRDRLDSISDLPRLQELLGISVTITS